MKSPLLPVYRRAPIAMARGEGVYLFDENGKRYLDFAAGMAVNALGHGFPPAVAALQEQAAKLWHCSNMYENPQLNSLAQKYVDATFADYAFFCSTGAEAVETGVKLVRRFQHKNGQTKRTRLITMQNGFHGRSMGGISAGGNDAAREGFKPLLPGFDAIPFNDAAALNAAVTEETAGILLEPVQGEGGIFSATQEFLETARALCDEHGLLLFYDEVQCGVGRCGAFSTYELYGIAPDVMAIAKGIGNGFPLAACLTTKRVGDAMEPGAHGSTYGGNPLAMAVGHVVIDTINHDAFLNNVKRCGGILKQAMEKLMAEFPKLIREVRGVGLMIGVEMHIDHRAFAADLRTAGLLTAPAYNNTIRLTPPLIIDEVNIAEAAELWRGALVTWSKK